MFFLPRLPAALTRVLPVVIAATAHAQTVAPVPPQVEPKRDTVLLEAFTVTGSNIKRIDQETTLPVTVISTDDLDLRGVSTAAEIFDTLSIGGPIVLDEGNTLGADARGDNNSINLRGIGSGKGKTAGVGVKGQKARSGGSIRLGFEGGQMPIYRRLPKRGFNNAAFKTVYGVVNLDTLEKRFSAGDLVNEESLRKLGLVNGRFDGVKILGRGEITKALTVQVDEVSDSARAKIEKAGGKVVLPKAEAA